MTPEQLESIIKQILARIEAFEEERKEGRSMPFSTIDDIKLILAEYEG